MGEWFRRRSRLSDAGNAVRVWSDVRRVCDLTASGVRRDICEQQQRGCEPPKWCPPMPGVGVNSTVTVRVIELSEK